ncbi:sugar-binding transcriptional regulator [Cohnella thailandensis]|uniref:Sugar-binding domain-containing protein n=1 Tax=Cohnella thailandensis TaxID=557557 RepID=A0A841T8R0_9BACL|nr:sugar-binding domain-containing protein [Cohnella thailandensis]MBB6637571.1 hypothetical protein [Cohnella thailandensis]MBP1974253.1 central glycolytic genes regulator [Cohnella thailandensis]
MSKILQVQKKLVPDLLQVMKKRYDILHRILISGTMGRRSLAASLDLTERTLRAELDLLREQGLLEAGTAGMTLSEAGRRLLEEMEPLVKELFGLSELEEAVRAKFGLRQVVVVAGDSDSSDEVKRELGRAGGRVLGQMLSPGDIVAVMGGTTMASMSAHFKVSSPLQDNWFVPARGGLGESVDYQANTIAAQLAKKTGARSRMLHVPDHLSEEAYQTIMMEPNVREVVDMIRRAHIVVHGIGDATTMARRRKLDDRTIETLLQDGALAEAFGYYFNSSGAVMHRTANAGLHLEDIEAARTVIGLAGGRSKGEAIAAVLKFGHDDILVTDEAAAEEALKHG